MADGANRWVFALDYGTTYTGFAYSFVKPNQDIIEDRDLMIFQKWHPGFNEDKIPSQVSYQVGSKGESQWGADIDPDTTRMVQTKLQLDSLEGGRSEELDLLLRQLEGMRNLNLQTISAEHGPPEFPSEEPQQVVAHYLRQVFEQIKAELEKRYTQAFIKITPLDLVITVPAMWSYEAKNSTYRAVVEAGFNRVNFPKLENIIMASEPECAAVDTIRSMTNNMRAAQLKVGDCIVLCDAGGGTVDLISFRVKSITPQIQLEELTTKSSYKCGASFIDRDFRNWLEQKLGPENYSKISQKGSADSIGSHTVLGGRIAKIMNRFEIIKRRCSETSDEEFIELPEVLSHLHDPSIGIKEGVIRISGEDLRELFNPWVSKTVELIDEQITQVMAKRRNVKFICLTGGFGTSKYLQEKLERSAYLRRIKLQKPPNPWTAVVRGALIKGVQKTADNLKTFECPRSYGLRLSEPFSAFKHDATDSYDDPYDKKKRARDQLIFPIKKGDVLFQDTDNPRTKVEFCRKFGVQDPRVFKTTLYACEEDNPPQSFDEAQGGLVEVGFLNYDLTSIPESEFLTVKAGSRGTPYFLANFELDMSLRTSLIVKLSMNGRELDKLVIPLG